MGTQSRHFKDQFAGTHCAKEIKKAITPLVNSSKPTFSLVAVGQMDNSDGKEMENVLCGLMETGALQKHITFSVFLK